MTTITYDASFTETEQSHLRRQSPLADDIVRLLFTQAVRRALDGGLTASELIQIVYEPREAHPRRQSFGARSRLGSRATTG